MGNDVLPREVAELLPYLTETERQELDSLLSDLPLWMPLPGPQLAAYTTQADIIGFGGAAGGGKTDLACGKALTQHQKVLILRRDAKQLQGIVDRLRELIGNDDGFNSQKGVWRLDGRQIELGSCLHIDDWQKYQGQAERQAVEQEIADQLEQVGQFDRRANQNYAALVSSYVATQAQRLGIPIPEMWQAHKLNIVGDIGNAPALNQALASAPPKGWVHSTNPQDVIGLWDDTTSARAIFWTGIDNQVAVEAADASDYSHSISADIVRHIKNRHGEDADGQLPVTAEDLVKIPEIIANYDEVRTNLQNPKTGGQRIAYAKRSEDGLLIYLEEYVRSRNNLKGVSMWKYPPTADVGNVLAHIARPSLYVRNGVAAYDNITADTENNQDALYQSTEQTAETQQFEETAQRYGGEDAYNQAKADGKTELTYRQWVQVRTPAFKQWFGDWENDHANASKVLNPKTGEPLVVYHGTAGDFEMFDKGRSNSKSNTGVPESVFFFTDNPEVASSYTVKYEGDFSTSYLNSGNVMPLFLNIRKPLKVSAKGANRNAYFLQQAMANSMEPIIWTAAYRQALEQGMSEADAAFFADGTIRQTQGSTLPEDISRAEGGTAFVRLFTQFMGYFNMQANLLGNGFVKLMRQGGLRQNKLAAAHLFMMGYFLPAAGAELIAAIGYGLKDDDGDGYADEILKTALLDGQVKNGLAMIPAVGQVGTFVYNRFNGKAYGSRLGGAPALSMAEAALLAPWSVAKAVDPDANYRQKRKGVYDTATLISMTLGLPVRGVLKAGEQADDWSGLDMFSEEQN